MLEFVEEFSRNSPRGASRLKMCILSLSHDMTRCAEEHKSLLSH